ncbi:MAG: hypothetical protein PUF51_05380 [Bifidobacteriaceae bacterium]|nr:hypothetical protein [Bifidobacteriaceae bacterium]
MLDVIFWGVLAFMALSVVGGIAFVVFRLSQLDAIARRVKVLRVLSGVGTELLVALGAVIVVFAGTRLAAAGKGPWCSGVSADGMYAVSVRELAAFSPDGVPVRVSIHRAAGVDGAEGDADITAYLPTGLGGADGCRLEWPDDCVEVGYVNMASDTNGWWTPCFRIYWTDLDFA